MKRFAIVSVVLLLIALLGVGAMYMTSNVTVIAQGVTALEAYRNYDLFTDLSAQVRAGAVVGTSFVAPQELSSAEDYVFYTYTFRLENNTTLPAEMIEVQITPMSGDILQIGSDQVLTLPAHTIGDVTATILTSKDMHAIREANTQQICVRVFLVSMPIVVPFGKSGAQFLHHLRIFLVAHPAKVVTYAMPGEPKSADGDPGIGLYMSHFGRECIRNGINRAVLIVAAHIANFMAFAIYGRNCPYFVFGVPFRHDPDCIVVFAHDNSSAFSCFPAARMESTIPYLPRHFFAPIRPRERT